MELLFIILGIYIWITIARCRASIKNKRDAQERLNVIRENEAKRIQRISVMTPKEGVWYHG